MGKAAFQVLLTNKDDATGPIVCERIISSRSERIGKKSFIGRFLGLIFSDNHSAM
jgi:hypothetical protein